MGKNLSDKELLSLLESRVIQAVGYHDSKLVKERSQVTKFYDGLEPAPLHKGNSKYISQDAWDAVESMKATLLETFSGNKKPVQFAPQGEEDVEMARIATEYVSYVFFRQNDGYSIFQDVIHDGLMNRNGVAKVWWDIQEEEVEEELKGVTSDELMMLAQDPDVDLGDEDEPFEQDEQGLIYGTVTRKVDTSQVKIATVPPEEFGISPRARCIEQADIVYHRTLKTKSDLIAAGYDPKLVNQITVAPEDNDLADTDEYDRFKATSDGWTSREDAEALQEANRRFMVYEVYSNIDMDNSKRRARLWKIVYCGKVVLDKERVSRKPFHAFVPLPKPHSFWGSSYASKVMPTQTARTLLTRSIIDHALITTNPRYIVTKGGLSNPKELMENRLGGVVNVTRPDAVMPLPQAGLNPFVFQTVAMLDADKEETTGLSSLSTGMNKDAVSKQNSADMVGQLVTLSQQRQKIVARNFAEKFLKPLFLDVYNLVLENETKEKVIEVAGNYQPVAPSAWKERKDVSVEFALGYGEQEKEAAKYLQLDQMLAADPRLGPMYSMEQRYNTFKRAMEASGIKDISNYLIHPSKIEPPQPDPMAQLQLQQMQQQLEVEKLRVQLEREKFEFDKQKFQAQQTLKVSQTQANHALKSDAMDLDEAEFEHKKLMDQAELVMVQKAPEVKASASVEG